MVRKITLFEIHLDDARFGTNETVEESEDTVADTQSDGPSVAKLVFASLFVSVAVTVIVRRLFGAGDDGFEETESPVEVEIDS
ncbi:hypothetical protein [Halapricum salinum]|uniref:Uncharacterized protein n=1 Tax=Halapricum salinum TaxID=1457250 RepID=A0A4D6H7T6_9EURY|nr:hypothetical protein [Halapricum salinum]QCC49883.1 hypothetical protein DV733_00985 [Halapricum salinum]